MVKLIIIDQWFRKNNVSRLIYEYVRSNAQKVFNTISLDIISGEYYNFLIILLCQMDSGQKTCLCNFMPHIIIFVQFVEQENASAMMQFWMAVDNFQTQLEAENSNYSTSDAQTDAMILYER